MSSPAPSLVATIESAERLWKQGDLAPAFEFYRDALQATLDSTASLSAADLVALERFADLAVLVGNGEAAAQALSVMADVCAAAGNDYAEDYAVLKGALVAQQNGRLKHALSLIYSLAGRFGDLDALTFEPEALKEWEAGMRWPQTDGDDRAVVFALFYLAASRVAASLGQYHDATEAARRGLVHAARETPLARRYQVPLLLAAALAAVQSGAFTRGAALLDEIAPRADAKRDPGFNFQFLELSAKLAMLRGDLGAALGGLHQAVELAAQWPARVRAACLENLAAFQILINQTANAAQALDQAAACVAETDLQHRERIGRLRMMADLRARSYAGDHSGSISSVWAGADEDRPLDRGAAAPGGDAAEQPVDFLAWFEQRALEFQLALGEGRIALAEQRLAAINEVFAGTDSDVVRLRLAYFDALLAYYRDQHSDAAAILSPLAPLLERAGLFHDLWQAQRLAGWVARRTQASKPIIDAAVEAETRTLNKLAASLDPVSRAIFFLNKWTVEEEAIARLADAAICAQSRPPSRIAPFRWWHTLQAWRKAIAVENRLEAGKRTLAESTTGASATSGRAVSLLDLWLQPRTHVYVTFSALPDRVVAIVRRRGRARVHVLDVSRISLRLAVKSCHERMLEPAAATVRRGDPLSAALAMLLANLPPCVTDVHLRADDALHGYPFAALRVEGVPIIERCTISLGYPVTHRRKAAASRTAVVLAADDPLGEHPALPQAAGEAAAIADLLSQSGFDVRKLIGPAATKADAALALGTAAIVHIACHGRFQPDQPARSGLVLPGADGAAATLSIAEIGAIDASRLEHVTLSACWSADNFVVPGRWIFSLPDTLCRAGARSVLASLWEADDRVAGRFMQRFYANLARMPRGEALREVQLACLRNQLCPGIDTSDPIFWAGFYLFGDAGSLQCH
jgi:hypothetical protein